MSKWTKEEVFMLEELYPNSFNENIVEKIGRSKASIIWKARNLGLKKSNSHMEKVRSVTSAEGGKITGRKNGRKSRIHFFDEKYFSEIDSEEKAYWLGFIQADGSILFNKSKNAQTYLQIGIQERDINLLEKFISCIKGSKDLIRYIEAKNENQQRIVRICLKSVYMIMDLNKLGIYPRKSRENGGLILEPTNKYFNHYIRGIFDGDGCATIVKGRMNFSICGTEKLCKDLYDVLCREASITGGGYYRCRDNSETRILRLNKKTDISKIYEWLYKNSSIFLDRKKEKFSYGLQVIL